MNTSTALASTPSAGNLKGKTLFITGASRGIGLAIAKRAAVDGANIVILAKTTEANPKLPGTIYSAAKEIEAAGGKPLMYKTGHSLIKARMKELDAPFGGEMSGHIFFKERWFGFDDGTYAAARLLEIVSRVADANRMLDDLPTSFSTPELNVACAEGEAPELVRKAVALADFGPDANVNTIDGLRVDWPDGFGLLRSSNTTPVLVLRFEGHTEAALARIQGAMMALLQQVKPDAKVGAGAH